MALPALACKRFLDTEDEWFHDDPYGAGDPSMSWALDEPELSPVDMHTHTDIFRGGSDAAAGKGGLVCASATESDLPTHADIFRGGSDADVVPAARGSGAVPNSTDLQSRVFSRTSTTTKAVHAPPPPPPPQFVHPNTVPSSLVKRLPSLKRAPGVGWRRRSDALSPRRSHPSH